MKHSEIQTKAPRILKWRRWRATLKNRCREFKALQAVERKADKRAAAMLEALRESKVIK